MLAQVYCGLMVMVFLSTYAFVPTASSKPGSESGSQIFAGQRFQLAPQESQQTTTSAVTQDYASIRRTLERLEPLVAQKQTVKSDQCFFRNESVYPCVRELHKFHYLPPFPLALPHEAPPQEIRVPMVPYFGWVPVKETRGGLTTIRRWQSAAKSGELVSCKGILCKVIVHAIGNSQENILAVCDVFRMQEVVGTPDTCKAIAILSSKKNDYAWVKAVIGYKYTSRRQETIRDQELYHKIKSNYQVELGLILKTCQKALSAPPLELETLLLDAAFMTDNTLSHAGFFARTAPRESTVLKGGWRENITLIIEVTKKYIQRTLDTRPDVEFDIKISTTFLVSFLDTNEWIIANKSHKDAYRKAIKETLKIHLDNLCEHRKRPDSQTLLCL